MLNVLDSTSGIVNESCLVYLWIKVVPGEFVGDFVFRNGQHEIHKHWGFSLFEDLRFHSHRHESMLGFRAGHAPGPT